MKKLRLLWFLLFFIVTSSTQGQAFKVYDGQKLLDSVIYYGLEKVVQQDSARLYQIGKEKIKQFNTFIQKSIGGCFSFDDLEKTQEEILRKQSNIMRMDSLVKDVIQYRDSISVQILDQSLARYSTKKSTHLIEMSNIIYNERPIIDESDKVIAYMQNNGIFVPIIQRYNQWLKDRTKYYELKDLFKDLK